MNSPLPPIKAIPAPGSPGGICQNYSDPSLFGAPEGPPIFIPEFDPPYQEVRTFLSHQNPKNPGTGSAKRPHLNYHVPLQFRGDFRPQDLYTFPRPTPQTTPEERKELQKQFRRMLENQTPPMRLDALKRVLCSQPKATGEPCSRRAQHRTIPPRCEVHGGALHPLDKIKPDTSLTPEDKAQGLSRYQQFKQGFLTEDDLDDEELATASFRARNGRLVRPKDLPRNLVHAFTKAIFDRAQQELRINTVDAARTLAEIMKDKKVDPDTRLKAANSLLERNLGKPAQTITLTTQAPWEEIFSEISQVSRQFSRLTRQQEPSSNNNNDNNNDKQSENYLDAEVISDDPNTQTDPNTGTQGNAESYEFPSGTGELAKRAEQNDNGGHSPPSKDLDGNGKPNRRTGDKPKPAARNRENPNKSKRENPNPHKREKRNPKHFARNPAILAQEVEIKPFEYKNLKE